MTTVGGSQANEKLKFGHVGYEMLVGCGSGCIPLLAKCSGWFVGREPWILDEPSRFTEGVATAERTNRRKAKGEGVNPGLSRLKEWWRLNEREEMNS